VEEKERPRLLSTACRKFVGSVESAWLSLRYRLPAEPEGAFQPVPEDV
jgi:hypothetical protein